MEEFKPSPALRKGNPAPEPHSKGITYLRTKARVTDFYSLLKSLHPANLSLQHYDAKPVTEGLQSAHSWLRAVRAAVQSQALLLIIGTVLV